MTSSSPSAADTIQASDAGGSEKAENDSPHQMIPLSLKAFGSAAVIDPVLRRAQQRRRLQGDAAPDNRRE
jgi:hypothetical protein